MSDELKAAAFLEEISRISVESASRIADLRVQITRLTAQVQSLNTEIERLSVPTTVESGTAEDAN